MKLKLQIEANQEGQLASAFREQLAGVAASAVDLDAAERQLRMVATARFWVITRGGHHVALNYQGSYAAPHRVAMIVEAS